MSDESDNESNRTASPEREEEAPHHSAEPAALDVAKAAEVIAIMERVDGRGEPLILTWKEGVENRVEAIGTDPRSKLVEADPAGKVPRVGDPPHRRQHEWALGGRQEN